MSAKELSYNWAKQKIGKDHETILCKSYDPYKDFKRDSSGHYVLIKIDWHKALIEVGICNKDHEISKIFAGRRAQDIYDAIFSYEKKHKLNWFKEKTHIAYLGKELKKAELAMVLGQTSYFQE